MEKTDQRAHLLAPIVAQFTAGVNALLDRVEAAAELDLGTVETELQALSRSVMGAVVGSALTLRGAAVERAVTCPECGAVPCDKGVQQRALATLVGPASWGRRYWWCPQCRRGWYPADQVWAIGRSAFSDAAQSAICRLGASLPFAAASATLTALTGIGIGARTVERLTEARGQTLEGVRDADWQALCAGDCPVPPLPLRPEAGVWAVALDAARLRLDGGWHEAKAGVIGWIAADAPRHLTALRYLSVVGSLEATGERLQLAARQRGLDPERAHVVCLADGAPGIWVQLAQHFPQRTEVLDWWHAVEHLWAAGNGVFGEGTAKAARWVAARTDRLWEGRVELVLRALRQAAKQPQGDAAAAELAYFTTHADRMRYAAFRAAGYPIASGAVESACKRVIAARTKQAGMGWTTVGAQGVLSLRADLLSGCWDEIWPLTRAA